MRNWIPTRREITANVAANVIVAAGAAIFGTIGALGALLRGFSPLEGAVLSLFGIAVGVLVAATGLAVFVWAMRQPASPAQSVVPPMNLGDVARMIKPLLDENRNVFLRFGPNSGANDARPARFDLTLWQKARADIIVPNNERIREILAEHGDVIPAGDLPIVEQMKAHIYAFREHVVNPHFEDIEHQFPQAF